MKPIKKAHNKKDKKEKKDKSCNLQKLGATRRSFLQQAMMAASGVALAPLLPYRMEAQTETNLFANPAEIAHQHGVLKAVIQLGDGKRTVPNSGAPLLRLFQGWSFSESSLKARPEPSPFAPGPTLRARVGGKMHVMFLNKIDDSKFPYSLDTAGAVDKACDFSTSQKIYPVNDKWPNCFHGSSTANLHFHGTHTDPDGLGDNVLVQVVPDKNTIPSEWAKTFQPIFDAPHPPASWSDMPADYQKKQLGYTVKQLKDAQTAGTKLKRAGLVGKSDDDGEKKATLDKRPAPSSLWDWDVAQVLSGQWPQYVVGAYPNSMLLPQFREGGPFQMGQAPGTHWYHAHKHGSTSLHIFNGLAGAIIMEGEYDDKIRDFFQKQLSPGHKFVERIMVFQGITAIQNLELAAGAASRDKLINGKLNPIIEMQPGEIQLWRMVNAMGGGNRGTITSQLFADLQAKGFKLRQTSSDGVQFSWQNYLDQPFLADKIPGGLTLAAGNRADILIQAPDEETTARFSNYNGNVVFGNLFVVKVAGTKQKMHFFRGQHEDPEQGDRKAYPVFPDFLKDLPTQDKIASTVSFEWDRGPNRAETTNAPPKFMLNGKQFGENSERADQCMKLGDVEDWLLTNQTSIPHPFHIHINPFQIVEIFDPEEKTPYKPERNLIWRDVVNIPAASKDDSGKLIPGSVRIRHRFADFIGTYVLHCHILAHEDRGMMQLVRVVKKDNYPEGCKLDHVAHH